MYLNYHQTSLQHRWLMIPVGSELHNHGACDFLIGFICMFFISPFKTTGDIKTKVL